MGKKLISFILSTKFEQKDHYFGNAFDISTLINHSEFQSLSNFLEKLVMEIIELKHLLKVFDKQSKTARWVLYKNSVFFLRFLKWTCSTNFFRSVEPCQNKFKKRLRPNKKWKLFLLLKSSFLWFFVRFYVFITAQCILKEKKIFS